MPPAAKAASKRRTAPLGRRLARAVGPALGLAMAVAAGGQAIAKAPPARNLLILTFDTTRADHLSVYGGRAKVPALERLAREGVRFEDAFAPAPLTLPSHASLLTGLYPTAHGVRRNGTHRLGGEARTLAELLQERGFDTAAVVGSRVLDSRYGLDQGFATYDDLLPPEETAAGLFLERPAEEVAAAGLQWLGERGEGRWFLWLHFFDPHWEYEPPEPFRTRYADEPYDGEIAYADAQAGLVLDFLRRRRWLDSTLVVATADHGESLDEHGESSHGLFIYDATMHVPLILRHPGRLPRGRKVSGAVSLVDVAPTVFDLLDVPFDAGRFHGSSLAPLAAGEREAGRLVWLESWDPRLSYGWSELSGVRDEAWKYVRAPRPELYAVAGDPAEKRDRIDDEPERAAEYRRKLEEMEAAITPPAVLSEDAPVDEASRRALESLGYVAGAHPGDSRGPRPDPKDRVGEFEAVQKALELVSRGRDEQAIPALRDLLETSPDSTYLRRHLGNALQRTGRTAEALRELERALRLDPQNPWVHADLGFAYLEAGDRDAARASFQQVLRLNPHVATALHNLGLIAQAEGRTDEARRFYERALQEDPNLLRTLVNLGTMYEKDGRVEEALGLYRRIIDLDPANERAFYSAGFLLFQAGRHAEAIELLDRAARAHPTSTLPMLYKAQVYRETGDLEAAERELRAALELEPGSVEALRGLDALERLRAAEEKH